MFIQKYIVEKLSYLGHSPNSAVANNVPLELIYLPVVIFILKTVHIQFLSTHNIRYKINKNIHNHISYLHQFHKYTTV